jgi:2-keto-3-deoxy-L-rhamnonate aldolase RhmA
MFESQQAFDHIDAILSMPGIHAVTLGPADLAQELGVFGTPDQGKVIDEYRTTNPSACRRHTNAGVTVSARGLICVSPSPLARTIIASLTSLTSQLVGSSGAYARISPPAVGLGMT